MHRRLFLTSLPLLAAGPALAAGGPAAADAVVDTTDLSLACDTALAFPIRRAAAAYRAARGVRVHVFPTAPPLLIPQLQREIQNDIIVTSVAQMDVAARLGLLAASAPIGPWRSPWVLAARREVADAAARAGRIAVVDPTGPLRPDGRALLPGLGLDPARAIGAVDTRGVAFLLTTGAASAGVLHLCEARAAGLRVLATLDVPPLACAAAITILVRRPKPEAFLAYLASREASGLLAEAGLSA